VWGQKLGATMCEVWARSLSLGRVHVIGPDDARDGLGAVINWATPRCNINILCTCMCVCVYMLFTPLGDGHFLVLFNHFITTSDICYSELSHFALVNSAIPRYYNA
jgi:hypothetical protein